mgnify:CR=1 FL=1
MKYKQRLATVVVYIMLKANKLFLLLKIILKTHIKILQSKQISCFKRINDQSSSMHL